MGPAVVEMARVEGLEAHRRAMLMRMEKVGKSDGGKEEKTEEKET